MILLTVPEIIKLHTTLTLRTGGSDGVRDMGLLESAVYSTESGFGDISLYPDIFQKSARLFYALTGNHAFVDGNKRFGLLVMLVTLRINGIRLRYTQQELIDLSLQAAQGNVSYEAALAWILQHKDDSL